MLGLCKGLLRRRSQKCPRRMQFSALHEFRQKLVRWSEVCGRSSEQASVWEKRCQKPARSSGPLGRSSEQASACEGSSQKPVNSSEHWVSLSEQVTGCDRSSELCGGSSERSSGWVRSSEPIIARANLMLSNFLMCMRKRKGLRGLL